MLDAAGDEQAAIRDTALGFALARIAPHALDWDRDHRFPIPVIRDAAALGMAGITVGEEHGGSGLRRLDAAVIFEALAMGCPTVAAYVSIHAMCARMIDRFDFPAQRAR